jgi:3-oxoacyl-[acyl-carrier protein] reductase
MNLNLVGKKAIVCGSTQGLGLASAIELSLLGANLTLISRNEEKLQAALTQLDTSKNQQHGYLVADFSDLNQVILAAEKYIRSARNDDEKAAHHCTCHRTWQSRCRRHSH